ncbi:hypothetical protein [Calidifontibacter terrae]
MNRMLTTLAATATLAAGVGATTAAAGAANAAPPTYGTGWTAVIHHAHAWNDNQGTLRMVSATGSSVTIGAVSDDASLQDVSGDGKQITTVRWVGGSDNQSTHFAFWDTATSTARFLHLPGLWHSNYTSGGNMLTWRDSDGLAYLRNSSGTATRVLHVGKDAALSVSSDGSKFVERQGKGMVVRATADGRLLRTVPSITGFNCSPGVQWDASSFTASCETAAQLETVRVYRVGYTSSVPTSALSDDGINGVLATNPRVGRLAAGAGPSALFSVTPTSHKPLAGAPLGELSGGYANWAFLAIPVGDLTTGQSRLIKYNTVTGNYSTLAGGFRGGVITQTQTIDGH